MASRRIHHREYGRPLPAATHESTLHVVPKPEAPSRARDSNEQPADIGRGPAFFPDCSGTPAQTDLLAGYDFDDDCSSSDYGSRRYGRQDAQLDHDGRPEPLRCREPARPQPRDERRYLKRHVEEPLVFRAPGPDDERIRDDVWRSLRCARAIDVSDIQVGVTAGEVTLWGSIVNRSQKHHAEDLAADVAGVVDVHNQLRLRHVPKPALAPRPPTSGAS